MKKLFLLIFIICLFACTEPIKENNSKEELEKEKKLKDYFEIITHSTLECIGILNFTDPYGSATNGLIVNSTSSPLTSENAYRDFSENPLLLTIQIPDDDQYLYKIGTILTFWNSINNGEANYDYHVKGECDGVGFYSTDSFAFDLNAKKIVHYTGTSNTSKIYHANDIVTVKVYTASINVTIVKWNNEQSGVNTDVQLGLYRFFK